MVAKKLKKFKIFFFMKRLLKFVKISNKQLSVGGWRWVTIWMVGVGSVFFSNTPTCSNGHIHHVLHNRNTVHQCTVGSIFSSSSHILRVAPMIEATPPAMTYFSPVVVPKPVSRSHFDRDVALRRLGCMVDLTHGSLSDYATVHNLYTSSLTNGNRAQSIKWMKQVNHHF